ncbi:protein BREAST CANCER SUSCEPTIBILITY 2 homolog B-like isoform X1 [Chenopodium quinoa]|uniref:protein BREAST CANCER SUSCEPTIBILITY 2 homolog B-like isoform X1 n=1 Tax=Chenopodium quinoa TaxID=63459 RepID=UPI000B789809|nr:protein BREAST CANCER SUSCEPTIBILITY 2 homolog B-like isoform X1 [Chenopodium quinoa]
MSTWQIFSDAGDNFRWEVSPSHQPSHQQTNHHCSTPPPSLPSFHDVLLQGCSKILEDCDNRNVVDDDIPMFRTGSGSSVVLKKSSIAKASSVLGDDFIDNFDTEQPCFKGNGFSTPNSMFQTGSGKKVNVSSSGLLRARALLSVEESNDDFSTQGSEPAKKKFRGVDTSAFEKHSSSGKRKFGISSMGANKDMHFSKSPFHLKSDSSGAEFGDEDFAKLIRPEMSDSICKPPAIKFNTAGGRFISVSRDALQRARNLLSDPEMDSPSHEGDVGASMFSFIKAGDSDGSFFNKENKTDYSHKSEQNPKIFVSPMKSSSTMKPLLETKSENLISGTNLMRKFDAEESNCKSNGKLSCPTNSLQGKSNVPDPVLQPSMANGAGPGFHRFSKSSGVPLSDISNTIGIDSKVSAIKKGTTTELKRLGKRSSVSPFKMPRNSKFITPLNSNLSSIPDGLSSRESEASNCRKRVCTRYPFQNSRLYVKEFFEKPPTYPELLDHIPEEVRQITPRTSEKYTFVDGSQRFGVENFYHLLVQSGASVQHASKEWVTNHFKWIVWKLASYERCYSSKSMKKFLTISDVLEELKYRYEREVNHGQRSAIKRILEGDASPSSMLVLCVSEIEDPSTSMADKSSNSRIELTDGWYSVCAQLDLVLSKQLDAGKLFVGQKLRICGAGLIGWNGPVSPLKASPLISLMLHINGTYRASWHERLGLCRGMCAPLAFRCIKDNGGLIPRTLVGVTRMYPVLYRERLKSGGYIVRSEKLEASLTQLYNRRRSNIIEGLTSDFQRGLVGSCTEDDYDNEGAKIMKMLESAAEPELLMAEMSSEQLASFSKYRATIDETRQGDLQRLIEKALEDAGLSARDVTPFMRVRVVGLKSRGQYKGEVQREGLITIWNPTEQQKLELVEGQAYAISGLIPSHSDLSTLYLQARGSSTKWKPLTTKEKESFGPFFNPRKPVSLSRMGEVPLSSEFDTAMLVLHVGLEYISGKQKKQWVFVTDGSLCETEVSTFSLLAINFCSPCGDDDSLSLVNYNLVGSIIGFCNLVKRTKDHVNLMWVAEATENSTYYLKYNHPYCSHLKDAFGLVKKWQQSASSTIEKLREKILHIVGGPKVIISRS